MRKTIKFGLMIMLLAVSSMSSAQKSPLTLGIRTGVTFSNIDIRDFDEDYKSKFGFQFGVTTDYRLDESFFIQSGILYTEKGSKMEGEGEINYGSAINLSGNTEMKVIQRYLEVPVLAAYKTDVSKDTKLVFNFGPYFAFGVGGETDVDTQLVTEYGVIGISEKFNTFGPDALKRFDFGFIIGVGAEFGRFVTDLNYELGVMNIARNGTKLTNKSASLTVGYKFKK